MKKPQLRPSCGFCLFFGFGCVHIGHQFVAGDGFLGQQVGRDLVQKFTILLQDAHCIFVALLQQDFGFFFDPCGSVLGAAIALCAPRPIELSRPLTFTFVFAMSYPS